MSVSLCVAAEVLMRQSDLEPLDSCSVLRKVESPCNVFVRNLWQFIVSISFTYVMYSILYTLFQCNHLVKAN